MKKLIFLVEDDASTMEVYKLALEGAGFEVDPIESGEEALEKIKEIEQGKLKVPDLILLDYILPGIDGFEVLEEIKKNSKTKKIKVFLTTNYSIEELKNRREFINGEKFILKADYSPTKMVQLIKKELGLS
ncbi:response regulator [Patescibacteria group bacterium]|nr:response regulator [Patescibacteria group bacterium]